MGHAADRNLLVGIIAMQMDFISRDQLIAGMQAWINAKEESLAEHLVRLGALHPADRSALEPLIDAHIRRHGGDAQKSLVAIGSFDTCRHELEALDDPDIERSLVAISRQRSVPSPDMEVTNTFEGVSRLDANRFRILRPHARGGLGEIYVAADQELNREVALKMIQSDYANDPASRNRFLLEAEITGALEHPGIVPVYGLGHYADGRPYYAMRFIRGDSLKEAADQFHERNKIKSAYESAEFRKLLGRFVDVCHAIEYSHSRGVLHRDLKPGNIMLGKYGETLVVDWGLAKAKGREERKELELESTIRPRSGSGSDYTKMGEVVGTPAYMSPEQAAGRLDQLSGASDVYSLGATLYYVLTGRPPFTKNEGDLLRRVERGEFPPPRQIKSEIPKPLEAICLQAMANRPADRYSGPSLLADDVEKYLADEPVTALADSFGARLTRFERRNRTLIRIAGAALMVMALGSTIAGLLVNEQRRVNEKLAKDKGNLAIEMGNLAAHNAVLATKEKVARKEAEEKSASLQMALAKNAFEHGLAEYEAGREVLGLRELQRGWMLAPEDSSWRKKVEYVLLDRMTRGGRLLLPPMRHEGNVRAVAFSPDGERLVTGGSGENARIWNSRNGTLMASPLVPTEGVSSIAFSPDGSRFATASHDRTVRFWNTTTGELLDHTLLHQEKVAFVAFSPGGEMVATASADKMVRLWDAHAGTVKGEPLRHEGEVMSLAFSPQGDRLATGCGDRLARLWDVQTGALLGEPMRHKGSVLSVAFDPSGKLLATASYDGTAQLWDADMHTPIGKPMRHDGHVFTVAFHPSGEYLATAGMDKTVKLWQADGERQISPPLRHEHAVDTLTFSADGDRLLTGSGKLAHLWNMLMIVPLGTPRREAGEVHAVSIKSDGTQVAVGCGDRTARILDFEFGFPIGEPLQHRGLVRAVGFSPDGNLLATGAGDNQCTIWDLRMGQAVGEALKHDHEINSIAFSPDGKRLATGTYDGQAQIWSEQTRKPLGDPIKLGMPIRSLMFSPDGERLVTACSDRTVRLWEGHTGVSMGEPRRHESEVFAVAFSPNGHYIAAGDVVGARLYDARTLAPIGDPMQLDSQVVSLSFSPDGKRLATGSWTHVARVWDVETGLPVGNSMLHEEPVLSVAFSPNGRWLVTGSPDRVVRVWNVTPLPIGNDTAHQIPLWSGFEFDFEQGTMPASAEALRSRQLQFRDQFDLLAENQAAPQRLHHQRSLSASLPTMNWDRARFHSQWLPNAAESVARALEAQPYPESAIGSELLLRWYAGDRDGVQSRLRRMAAAPLLGARQPTGWARALKAVQRSVPATKWQEDQKAQELWEALSQGGVGDRDVTEVPSTLNDLELWWSDGRGNLVGKRWVDMSLHSTRLPEGPLLSFRWLRQGAELHAIIHDHQWRIHSNGSEPPEKVRQFPEPPRIAEISEDGSRTAFARTTPQPSVPEILVWKNDQQETSLGLTYDPAWFADNQRLAYLGGWTGTTWRIAIWDGTKRTFLTVPFHSSIHGHPFPSPDGEAIAFATLGDDGTRQIGLVSIDGKRTRQLTHSGQLNALPSFSPDGRYVAYVQSQDDGRQDLRIVDVETEEETLIAEGVAFLRAAWRFTPTKEPDSSKSQ